MFIRGKVFGNSPSCQPPSPNRIVMTQEGGFQSLKKGKAFFMVSSRRFNRVAPSSLPSVNALQFT
jgi:hypothetical protein